MSDNASKRLLALALSRTPGIGGKSLTRVLTRNELLGRSPQEFLGLNAESLIEEYGLKRQAAEHWADGRTKWLDSAKQLADRLDRLGIAFVTAADPHYPALVDQVDPDPPAVLYMHGNQRLLQARTFAIFASRNAPPAAGELIERLTEEGVLGGEVLVSGHNTPEYQRSAVVPLRWGAPRILCLDRELFDALGSDLKEEPFRTARLWRHQFDATTDLAITPIQPDRAGHPAANRQRDRLIAGLAKRHDYAYILCGGNMEKLARQSIRAGRKVRVSDLFIGAREWTRYGAEMISD